MRHPLVLAVVMAGWGVVELNAQPTRGNGTGVPRPGQRGPDLSRVNESAGRILDRPGRRDFEGPFGFVPFFPYYAPPVFYGPRPFYDPPFLPFPDLILPGAYGRPNVPAQGPLPPAPGNGNGARNNAPAVKAPANNPPPPRPAPVRDEIEQRAEMQKHIRTGNDAFANGEYGVALKRYELAVGAAPLEPMGYFHLAQAQLALGKHAPAVASIQRGLRLHSKWPESGFQPRALYGDRGGEFDQHLAQLADLIAKNLNDDSLLFLLAYELWFDAQRDQAIKLFERAAALAFDTTFIDRFLKGPKVAGP